MEGYSSVTPRLRVARNSSNYGISQIVTATDGPSHLPEFSQLVDLNLKEMAPFEVSEQPSTSTVPGPSIPAHTENPAAVLRALLSRLPAESKNTQPSRSPSQQYLSERESDYDMDLTDPANATRSIVQENLKDIFSKARRDPGDTPQKARTRRGSNASMDKLSINAARDDSEGKRRSLSDEWDNTYGPSHRPATRLKHSPQPVTLEFLRERFSESRLSVEGDEHPPSSRHDFSNDAAIISQESNSFQSDIPMATSTPQQSLRISVNSQFQSNLLDQDTEMQHAIDELDSYGESSANRPSKHVVLTITIHPAY
ncbi:hypothetical protein BDN70DRAFT_126769 [Pholiota conissans]|uniref:Uncharacterized protein n=1 Tax=Pholiota conissans TaxID=109636 RepID=A0A9P5ZBB2_9AGAR|nr:hypothetical protein BDN70DRAFT_126769 [Pholiota conissans]